jgi:beta-mannosidase
VSTLDLNGTWKLRWSDGQRHRTEQAEIDPPEFDSNRWIDATVPGEVHLEAMKQGWIADPAVGTNVLAARWVEECWWTYRRTFTIDSPPGARAWLVFDQLDYGAVVRLNGVEIGRHANVFYPCRIDVTGKLRAGENVLLVTLDPGLFGVSDRPAQDWWHWPDQILNKRHWQRKPQCQFGWDWAPRLINCGITRSVRLEWTDAPARARADQFVPLVTLSPDLKHGHVRARWFVEGLGHQAVAATLRVEMPELGITRDADAEVRPGLNPVELAFDVNDPEPWWPVGQGPQKLYAMRATLEVDGKPIATVEKQVGFRHVRIIDNPHPEMGRYFNLEINGRRIFAKGGNWVPADFIFARIDRERYEKLIDLALEQNFNFLRVWGGGLYEADEFYELCDRRGILVWQEFIFACSRYPLHEQPFFEDVKREAAWNVRRLAGRPSLVVWCGNNEIEWGDWDWDYGHKGVITPDHGFFHIALPRLVQQEDGTRPFHPSSPFSPDRQHPNSDHVGDQHPWSVGFFNTDFRQYRNMYCRYPDEGGMLGPTALPTVRACVAGTADERPLSFAWQVHDNSCITWTQPSVFDQWLRDLTGRDARDLSLEEAVYFGGLLQAEALKEYVENFRRRMFDSGAAVFWMFNDYWPATRSWTTVDYSLRRTPSFHPVRRAMAPVHVVLAQEGAEVVAFGINDTTEAVEADLQLGVFEFTGDVPVERRGRGTLPPNTSTRLASFPLSDWSNPESSAAFAVLRRGDQMIARNRLMLPPVKELRWPKSAEVKVDVADGVATFRSATFAWNVCLDLDGEQPLADNFFDVYPEMPYRLPWPFDHPPRALYVASGPQT